MTIAEGLQQMVALFDATATTIEAELSVADFDELLAGERTLIGREGSIVRAAYVEVGTGLAVKALVFFQVKVDARGCLDPSFNVPLEYMAQQAGAGPDLGSGPVRMACRSQCPIPWHAINLWEPAGRDESHVAVQVQKILWRNRLGLRVSPATGPPLVRIRGPLDAVMELDEAMKRETAQRQAFEERRALEQRQAAQQAVDQRNAQEQLLTAAFGEAGRVSVGQYARSQRAVGQSTRPSGAQGRSEQLRTDGRRPQQGYVEQIAAHRDEIQKLKAALRHEQERNRRLQQLLRGEL
jgi:hypothetical protein